MQDTILEDAYTGSTPQLMLFQKPVVQTAIKRAIIGERGPTGQQPSTQDAPIYFHLSGDSRNYLDLSKTRLKVQAKIVNEDGTPIAKDKVVAPVNLTLQSLFSLVEMKVCNQTVNLGTNGCYPYVAILQSILRNSSSAKSGHMAAQMYFKETGEDMDGEPESNPGFIARQKYFAESKSVSMEGPLAADFCSTNRFILCNVPIEFVLHRSSPQFVIQSKGGEAYKMVIESIYLKPYYLECSPATIAGHAKALEKPGARALYPFTRTECRSYNIAAGSTHFTIDKVFNNTVPRLVVCALVKSEAYSGKFDKNPFAFSHFNISQLELTADGISLPGKAMTFKFDEYGRDVCTPFLRLYDCIGATNDALFGNGLDLEDYVDGNAIFAFPLGGADGNHLELVRKADVRLNGTFSKPTAHSLTLIVYSEQPTVAAIDKERSLIIE